MVATGVAGFGREVVAVLAGILRFCVALVPGAGHMARAGGAAMERARRARPGAAADPRARPTRARPVRTAPRRRTEAEQRAWERRRALLRRRLRLVAIVAGIAALVLGWVFVPASDVFRIRHVEISGASNVGDLEARMRVDELLRGETVFTVDEERVARELEELPFVRRAHVERHLPGGLELRLLEYRPLALGYGDRHFWLIARDGRILSRASQREWRGRVPVVSLEAERIEPGMRVSHEPAMQVLAVRRAGSTLALESVVYEEGALTGVLEGGVTVRFGRPELLSQKVLVAEAMLGRARRDDLGELVYIDVTVPSKPAVCPRSSPGCLMARARDQAEADAAAQAREDAKDRDAAAGADGDAPSSEASDDVAASGAA